LVWKAEASFKYSFLLTWCETNMNTPLKILGIAGSLRKKSYNRAALRCAQQLAPESAVIEIFELDGIPPYNDDDLANPPAIVTELKARIGAADAILFVSPEYNYSIPGVLKNAIDWASRPYGQSAWTGKPVGVMGAATGVLGTARMQYHLRQCFVFLNMYPLNLPEVMITNSAQRFDEQGNLVDEATRDIMRKFLQALVLWTRQVEHGKQIQA
jgi:chromate reductase, NAD(P)H dehydrogenase (quinone)